MRRGVGRVPVPCNGCVACCYTDVEVGDEPKTNQGRQHTYLTPDGRRFLMRTPEGHCVHLKGGRCSIYQFRPLACRGYDCRLQGLAGMIERFDGGQSSPRWTWKPTPSEGLKAMVREVVSGRSIEP